MVYRGPDDPTRRQEWQRARRAVARQHHPDRGGCAARLQADLLEIDRRFALEEQSPHVSLDGAPIWQPASRIVRRTGRRLREGSREVRRRIPSGWPGSRRYFDL